MEDINFRLYYPIEILDIKKDGFVGKLVENEKTVIIKDRIALKNIPYVEGEIIELMIEAIRREQIGEEIYGKTFYCLVNELTNNGFYTKDYNEGTNRYKRVFNSQSRGMIIVPDEEMERFQVGDLLRIEVKNA